MAFSWFFFLYLKYGYCTIHLNLIFLSSWSSKALTLITTISSSYYLWSYLNMGIMFRLEGFLVFTPGSVYFLPWGWSKLQFKLKKDSKLENNTGISRNDSYFSCLKRTLATLASLIVYGEGVELKGGRHFEKKS